MRKDDHQLLMPYYEGLLTKDVKYDAEKTGLGWKTDATLTAAELTLPTTCKMKRPPPDPRAPAGSHHGGPCSSPC